MIERLVENISEIKRVEETENNNGEVPGIVGYTTKANESLWDIAKRYKTTIGKIMEINDMKTNNIKGSEKIIIAKSIRI